MIPGARVDLTDGRALLLYPTHRQAWARLTRLLSVGKARGGKGCCVLDWSDVTAHADGLIAILVPDLPDANAVAHLADLRAARSEEHTSELQSLMRISYAVFCLKKKKYTVRNANKTRLAQRH